MWEPGAGGGGGGGALAVCALCGAWYASSSASNVLGALVLARFPYPLSVSAAQLVGVVALCAAALPAAGVRPAPRWGRRRWLRVLLPLAAAKLLTAVCSHVSLWKVPVSYAHTVKATTPLWTALLARVLLGERQSRAVLGALGLIALGVCVASATELRFDAVGLGASLGAAALPALQHLYSKRALGDAQRPHPLRLLEALSRGALSLCVPLWLCVDAPLLWAGGWRALADGRAAGLLAADAALAWLQAALAFAVLSRVSPLAYGVASAAKRAAVVGASLLVLRNPAPPANVAGMALAALGVLAYNRAKASDRAHPAPTPAPAAPYRPLLPV